MVGMESPLVACYISGLDLRRVDPNSTPFLTQAFGQFGRIA